MKTRWVLVLCSILGMTALILALAGPANAWSLRLTTKEQLGKALFFDKNLSLNNNQACAACHGPQVGYTGPDFIINATGGVYEGSIPGAFGNRKPPASAYAGDSPKLHFDGSTWVGGMFWDGRATGDTLGDPLAEQAKGPFLNPKEQAIPDAATLCNKVAEARYAGLYRQVWGEKVDCSTDTHVEKVYNNVAFSIAAFERSGEVTAYTSKFDRFWLIAKAKGADVTQINMSNWAKYNNLGLTTEEVKGLALFNSKATCSNCHTLDAGPAGFPLFTDFTYDNLGVPKNLYNPATLADPAYADPGLGGYLKNAGYPADVYEQEMGKFKVPTLRNVALRSETTMMKDYGHNGFFKSLYEVVHFYNTRDVVSWPAPEIAENMNKTEVGNLHLTPEQEIQIVSFLKTLSDGFQK